MSAIAPAARWFITRSSGLVFLHYRSLITGEQQSLGKLDGSVSDELIIEWVAEHGHTNIGDELQLSCGSILTWGSTGFEIQSLHLDSGMVLSSKSVVLA